MNQTILGVCQYPKFHNGMRIDYKTLENKDYRCLSCQHYDEQEKAYYTVAEAAFELNVSDSTIYRWIKISRLDAVMGKCDSILPNYYADCWYVTKESIESAKFKYRPPTFKPLVEIFSESLIS